MTTRQPCCCSSSQSQIAKRKQEKADEIVKMNNNKADLKNEQDYKTKITPDCDWIIGAWAQRAKDRTAEHDGLVAAKEYLAGYQGKQETALLESGKNKFDDSALSGIGFVSLH